jgi:hypothetical protein
MNNHTICSAQYIITAIGFVFLGVLCCDVDAGTQRNWSREPFVGTTPEKATSPFAIVSISSIDSHIVGYCGYVSKIDKDFTYINGSRTTDGAFWPNVTYQVGDEFGGTFKTIGKSVNKGNPLALRIKSMDTDTILHVDLDMLHAMVGKYQFGRIVLDNGESTTFALKFLSPPVQENY